MAAFLHGSAVESLIYSDTAGIMDSFAAYEAMNILGRQKERPILEYHGHNHYGLATANCLGALQGGAERVAVSVAGVGSKGHPKRPVSDKQLKQLYGGAFSADMPAKAKEAGKCLCKIG